MMRRRYRYLQTRPKREWKFWLGFVVLLAALCGGIIYLGNRP